MLLDRLFDGDKTFLEDLFYKKAVSKKLTAFSYLGMDDYYFAKSR
jgi:hypothetical protein